MFGRILRGSTRNARGGDPNHPTVATNVSNSSVVDVSAFAWGTIKFTGADPGVVTIYDRSDVDDTPSISRLKAGAGNITFSPGTGQAYPIPDDVFYYNEVYIVSANAVAAGSCKLTLKA